MVGQNDIILKRQVQENRKSLYGTVSTIVFCGTHDWEFHGRSSATGNAKDVFMFLVLADESSYASRKEQSSLRLVFIDTTKPDNLVRDGFGYFIGLTQANVLLVMI